MRIRIIPAFIVLSLLAVIASACSVVAGAQPDASLAPQMTVIASRAAAGSGAENAASKEDLNNGTDVQDASAPAAQQPAATALSLPAETRTNDEGSVTVAVTPAGGTADTLIFDVSMNTHSVELDHDMTKIASLRDDQGRTYAVKDWNGAAGGHHREGSLTFEVPAGAAPRSFELNLAGISGVPSRLFQWNVK
jgi:hypothetical protein